MAQKWKLHAYILPSLFPVVFADSENAEKEKTHSRRLVRPSQLPIYESPQDLYEFVYEKRERTAFEEGLGKVRQELQVAVEATQPARENVMHIFETGKAHTLATWNALRGDSNSTATMDYVFDEENVLPRVGVIAGGGLIGLLLGARRRGGFFKKLIYSSAGLAGAASLCYPHQAYQISQDVAANASVYTTIAYNFVKGAKPQSKTASSELVRGKQSPPQEEGPASEYKKEESSDTQEVRFWEYLEHLPLSSSSDVFDYFVKQSSDVTLWGFRLFDQESNKISINLDASSKNKDS